MYTGYGNIVKSLNKNLVPIFLYFHIENAEHIFSFSFTDFEVPSCNLLTLYKSHVIFNQQELYLFIEELKGCILFPPLF